MAAGGGVPRHLLPEFGVTRYPTWSPDGKHVLFYGTRDSSAWDPDWWVAPLDGGAVVRTGALAVFRSRGLSGQVIPGVWIAEGQRVLFGATRGDARNLWQVVISPADWRISDPPRPLTSGTGSEDFPSAAAGRVAFASLTGNIDIWSLPLDVRNGKVAGEMRRLTENASPDFQPAISADGRHVVFVSNRSGNEDIWIRDVHGAGKETSLTISPAHEAVPAISPDGTKLAYVAFSFSEKNRETYVLRLMSSGAPAAVADKVCDDCFVPWHLSSRGDKLLYWSMDQKQIGLLNLASREKFIVLKHPQHALLHSQFSPDDRWISFLALIGLNRAQIFIVPFRGASQAGPEDWIAVTGTDTEDDVPRWSLDGNTLYFASVRDGYRCLWKQVLDPSTKRPVGSATPLYHFHGARRSIGSVPVPMLQIAFAQDKVVFPMAERGGNIWMAEWDNR